jgi:hypothetical protein
LKISGVSPGEKRKSKTMGTKAGRKRPSQQNQVPSSTEAVPNSIHDFEFWRRIASELVPGEKDEWKIGEVACIIQQVTVRVGEHWRKISQIVDKTEAKSISISVPVKIMRMNTPPEVFAGIKYSEKYGDGLTVKVPDPNQKELPMKVEHGGKATTAEDVHNEATAGEGKGGKKEGEE